MNEAYSLSDGFRGSFIRSIWSFLNKTGRYSTSSSTNIQCSQMLKFLPCSQLGFMHLQPYLFIESALSFMPCIHFLPVLLALLQIHCFESMSLNLVSLHLWLFVVCMSSKIPASPNSCLCSLRGMSYTIWYCSSLDFLVKSSSLFASKNSTSLCWERLFMTWSNLFWANRRRIILS